MKTRLTELLGIKYPIVQAGMSLVADVNLCAAVCNAGGLGIFGSAGKTTEEVREAIHEMRERTDKPFGVNILEGDPLQEEHCQVLIEEEVPVISHGKGKPDWLIHATKRIGSINMPTVGALRQAVRAEQEGAAAVIVQGWEGGGHTGHIGGTILLPQAVSRVKIPVIAAGGYCDGAGLVSALALGAEGIYVGTRFALTRESPIPQKVKERYLAAREEDAVVTAGVTGTRCRMLKNKLVEYVESQEAKGFRPRQWMSNVLQMKREFNVSYWRLLIAALRYRKEYEMSLGELGTLTGATMRARAGLVEGDADWGSLFGGQVMGRITDIPTCTELIERIMSEAEAVIGHLELALRG